MSGPDVFISYNHADAGRARLFADKLGELGFSVWWDASLRSGETFDEVTERALDEARAVVVLWSPNSVTSRWVRAEATEADRAGKLVPATIAPCKRPLVFELTQTPDLSHWQGDTADAAWQQFVADLRHVVGETVAPLPAATQPTPASAPTATKAGRRLDRRLVAIVAGLAVLAIAAWIPFRPVAGDAKLTDQPIQVASFAARGGPDAALMAETLKNTEQDILGDGGFRTLPVDMPQGKLGLAVKGSIISSANTLKVFVQIEHLPTGETVWSGQFEDKQENSDRLATMVSVATTESLNSVRDAERQDGLVLTPDDISSFIAGGNMVSVFRPEDAGKPEKIFTELVERLPQSAHGQAMLAIAIDADGGSPEMRKRAIQRKTAAIQKAISIDPASAGAAFDTRYGLALQDFPGQVAKQEDILLDGLRQAPEFPYLSMRECDLLLSVGRINDALPYCQRASALRPTSAPIAWRAVWVQLLEGRQGLAEQSMGRALRYFPDAPAILLMKLNLLLSNEDADGVRSLLPQLAMAYPQIGDREIAAIENFLRVRKSGTQPERDRSASEIEAVARAGGLRIDQSIFMLATLGNSGAAFDEILASRDLSRGSRVGLSVIYHPALASLRQDTRFWNVAGRVGLIDYWNARDAWPDFCGREMPLATCKAMAAKAATAYSQSAP